MFWRVHHGTSFMVFSETYTICQGPKLDACMSQSVMSTNCHCDISCQHKKFFFFQSIYIMTFNVVHWNIRDDGFAFWYARGRDY